MVHDVVTGLVYTAAEGTDAARLTTQGFGASKPAMPNATAEGRAANRRVELVKR